MGEKAHLPNENGISNESPNEETPSDQETSDASDEDLEDMSPEEFQMLDSQLDALNSALDDIEQKNDDIHAQLLLLLQSNREIRRQMRESNQEPQQQDAPMQQ